MCEVGIDRCELGTFSYEFVWPSLVVHVCSSNNLVCSSRDCKWQTKKVFLRYETGTPKCEFYDFLRALVCPSLIHVCPPNNFKLLFGTAKSQNHGIKTHFDSKQNRLIFTHYFHGLYFSSLSDAVRPCNKFRFTSAMSLKSFFFFLFSSLFGCLVYAHCFALVGQKGRLGLGGVAGMEPSNTRIICE